MVAQKKNPPFLARDIGLLDFLVAVEAIAGTYLQTIETGSWLFDFASSQTALGVEPPLSFLAVKPLESSLQDHLLTAKILDL